MGVSGSKKRFAPSALALKQSMFDFSVKDGAGAGLDLGATYRGKKKAFLVVNVATE